MANNEWEGMHVEWFGEKADGLPPSDYNSLDLMRFQNLSDRLNKYWVTELNDAQTRKSKAPDHSFSERAADAAWTIGACAEGEGSFIEAQPFSPAQEAGNKGFFLFRKDGRDYIIPWTEDLSRLAESENAETVSKAIKAKIKEGKMIEAPTPGVLNELVSGVEPGTTKSKHSLAETIELCRKWREHLQAFGPNAPWANEQVEQLLPLEGREPVHRLRQLEAVLNDRATGNQSAKSLEVVKQLEQKLGSAEASAGTQRPGQENKLPEKNNSLKSTMGKVGKAAGPMGVLFMLGNLILGDDEEN